MIRHIDISNKDLYRLLKMNTIGLGGNINLKIYGTLSCKSGRRMRKENRVFFRTEKEAIDRGFRPCGHCLSSEYKKWKYAIV